MPKVLRKELTTQCQRCSKTTPKNSSYNAKSVQGKNYPHNVKGVQEQTPKNLLHNAKSTQGNNSPHIPK
ncbi:5118_t:CDS:2, partial [Dentiscutata heterogama]